MPETTYESISPFVQAEWRFADAWLLTGGLRHERGQLQVDDYLTIPDQRTVPAGVTGTRYLVTGGTTKTTETLPNLGLVWEATDALKLYASYAEGYTVADIGRVLRGITATNGRPSSRAK